MDISTFRAAIRVRESGGRIERAALAFAGVGPRVLRLPETEAYPGGQAVRRGDVPRGRPAGEGGGRADLRRPGLARLPPDPGRERPAQVLPRGPRGRAARGRPMPDSATSESGTPRPSSPRATSRAGPGRSPTGPGPEAIDPRPRPVLGSPLPHESARAHVTGRGRLHRRHPADRGASCSSTSSAARSPAAGSSSIDVAEASRGRGRGRRPDRRDIPGARTFGPVFDDEEVLAVGRVPPRRPADRPDRRRDPRGAPGREGGGPDRDRAAARRS